MNIKYKEFTASKITILSLPIINRNNDKKICENEVTGLYIFNFSIHFSIICFPIYFHTSKHISAMNLNQ